jgi:hypothetical protein
MDSVVEKEAAEHGPSEEKRKFHKFVLNQIDGEALIPGSKRVLPLILRALEGPRFHEKRLWRRGGRFA